MIDNARSRSKINDLEFKLNKKSIIVPDTCPALGIPLFKNSSKCPSDNSPTIDRYNTFSGYTPNNISIISCKANVMKSNCSNIELKKILDGYKTVINGK